MQFQKALATEYYNTRGYWVLFIVQNYKEHNILETGSVSVLRWRDETANVNHWATPVSVTTAIHAPEISFRLREWIRKLTIQIVEIHIKGKVKVKFSCTGRGGPLGCERLRLPHFLDNRLTDGGKVVSPTRRPLFTPTKIPCTHFC
jgi:hypothetical protein